MEKVVAQIGAQKYKTVIANTSGNATLIADEPEDIGGEELGFSPTELLAASLAACTSITLKMYLDRKEWSFEDINVQVTLDTNKESGETTLNRVIHVNGNLDDAQSKRVIAIANACPVHKILSGKINVLTILQKD